MYYDAALCTKLVKYYMNFYVADWKYTLDSETFQEALWTEAEHRCLEDHHSYLLTAIFKLWDTRKSTLASEPSPVMTFIG